MNLQRILLSSGYQLNACLIKQLCALVIQQIIFRNKIEQETLILLTIIELLRLKNIPNYYKNHFAKF